MSRDTKPRTRKGTSRKQSAGGTLVGIFIGLVIGVLAAAGVVWYIHKTPVPIASKSSQPQTPPPATPGTPLALPGKPGDPLPQPGDKPRFDFYKILPGNGEAIPESKSSAKPEPKQPDPPKDKDSALKEPVYLQTGSFQSAADADNQKARLAMIGAEASIQQVMLQDKVWYRVRIGPFRKIEEVNALRAELARQGVDTAVVKKD